MRRESLGLAIAAGILTIAFCAVVLASFGYDGPRDVPLDRWLAVTRGTGATNIVSSIYLSARLFDTLLEILVFAVAVLGVRFYLTTQKRPERIDSIPESQIVLVAADVLLAPILLIGIYVVIYGHLSPGGGFAGGVIAATGLLFAAIAQGTSAIDRRLPLPRLHRIESGALLAILGIAVLPAVFARPLLGSLLPPGTVGTLRSGGGIPLLNVLIGAKVFVGSWVIVKHFVDHRGEI